MASATEHTGKNRYKDNMKLQGTFKAHHCILTVLIIAAVVESLALVGLAGHWRVSRDDILAPRQQQICFHLDKFVVEEDEEKKKQCPKGLKEKFERKTNSTLCCGILSDVLDRLLSKSLPERYNSNTNPEMASLDLTEYNCKARDTPEKIGRLVDLATSKKPVAVGLSTKLFWNSKAPSHTTSGLRYLTDDGTMYVEETGYYSVSLQLKSKLENTSDTNDYTDPTIRHYVHLISKGTGAVILEDAKSLCRTTSDETETTSVMEAVFKLHHGDRLYVATSHPQSIAADPHSNFFSIHSI